MPSVVDAVRVDRRRRRAGDHRASARRRAAHHRRRRAATSRRVAASRCAGRVEFNIEGDPRPDLMALVHEVRPDQCTLVPVLPGEVTSQGGWPARHAGRRAAATRSPALRARRHPREPVHRPRCRRGALGGGRSAPIASSCSPSRSRGRSTQGPRRRRGGVRTPASAAAEAAHEPGSGVNAGHDLDHENLVLFRELPHLDEVSIGHALDQPRAVRRPATPTVREYLARAGGRADKGTGASLMTPRFE